MVRGWYFSLPGAVTHLHGGNAFVTQRSRPSAPGGMGVARALEIHESSWGVYLVLVHAVLFFFQFQHLGLFLSSSFL